MLWPLLLLLLLYDIFRFAWPHKVYFLIFMLVRVDVAGTHSPICLCLCLVSYAWRSFARSFFNLLEAVSYKTCIIIHIPTYSRILCMCCMLSIVHMWTIFVPFYGCLSIGVLCKFFLFCYFCLTCGWNGSAVDWFIVLISTFFCRVGGEFLHFNLCIACNRQFNYLIWKIQ